MTAQPLILLLIGFLIASPIITLISLLYIREYHLRKQADKKKAEIVQETQIKSAELLTAAQIVDTKILSDSFNLSKDIQQQFKTELNGVVNSSSVVVQNAQKDLANFLTQLKGVAQQSQFASERAVEAKVADLFEKLEQRLSDFLMKTEASTTSSIELELKSAKQLIEGYKTQQLALIDENILAMMEQTLDIVLAKKLSLKDQLDLIYEALEKAKVEKFLV